MQLHQLRAACDHPWLAKGFQDLKLKLMSTVDELDEGDEAYEEVQEAASDYKPSAKLVALSDILVEYAGTHGHLRAKIATVCDPCVPTWHPQEH